MTSKDDTTQYLRDILDQPVVLQDTLAHLLGEGKAGLHQAAQRLKSADRIVFSGMGSAYLSAMPAAQAAAKVHPNVHLVETSALLAASPFAADTVYVVLSRSGESGEIADFAKVCKTRGGTLIAVTMTPTSTLAKNADAMVEVRSSFDGLICVKAHTTLMLATLLLVDAMAKSPTASVDLLSRTFSNMAQSMPSWLAAAGQWPQTSEPKSVYFIAAEEAKASAGLGALLIEEGVWLPSAIHTIDGFAHGPLELADPEFTGVVIDLAPTERSLNRIAVIRRNAPQTLVITHNRFLTAHQSGGPTIGLDLEDLPVFYRPLVAAPFVQLLTFALAERRGRHAGQMRHLNWLVT